MTAEQSDPTLLEAYRKQLRNLDPALVFLAWQGQAGITHDDLIDGLKDAVKYEETPPNV